MSCSTDNGGGGWVGLNPC
uniref:Uncharacterized protein n=1 Tax=Rhizophora mucronata TaxID=61149 RepID=A0A2P2PZX8_RHIMU